MLSMDQNTEELHRLWEEIRQVSTTSCSSLTTEKQSDLHSNLSTPSLISDLDLPSPLSVFSVESEDIFNFELGDILDPSPTEKKGDRSEAAFQPIPPEGSHPTVILGEEVMPKSPNKLPITGCNHKPGKK